MKTQTDDLMLTCKTCGCRLVAGEGPLPRVERCPKCGDAVLLDKSGCGRSDSRSFWTGFFLGRLGVLWSGLRKGWSGADHAAAGAFIQWLSGLVIMLLLAIVAFLWLWIKST